MTAAPAARVLAFAGSTRRASFNKRLMAIAAEGARQAGACVTSIDLRDYPLPLYDGDLEAAEGLPAAGAELKALFKDHDGLLIAAPEYNGSISAVLKNTIDWVSRPVEGEPSLSAFTGKVAGLVAASPGRLGGLRGLVHVRQILSGINVLVIPEQRAVPGAASAFEADGRLADPDLQAAVEAIGAKVARVAARLKS